MCLAIAACSIPEPPQTGDPIPKNYADKHMPEGWWNKATIIEEGRQLYLGATKSGVNCANCHGKTGKPLKSGVRDFRDTETMKKYSDSHLLWRISEGVPFSKMRGFKGQLTEKEVWKVIAFISTIGMEGLKYDSNTQSWISS